MRSAFLISCSAVCALACLAAVRAGDAAAPPPPAPPPAAALSSGTAAVGRPEFLRMIPPGEGDIKVDSLSIAGFNFTDARGHVVVTAGAGADRDQWSFTNVTAKMCGGTVTVDEIEVFATPEGKVGFRLSGFKVRGGDLAAFIQERGSQNPIPGRFDLDLRIESRGRRPNDFAGEGLVTVVNADFGHLPVFVKVINFLNKDIFTSSKLTHGQFQFVIDEKGYTFRKAVFLNDAESLSIEAEPGGQLTHQMQFNQMILVPKQNKGGIIDKIPLLGIIWIKVFGWTEYIVRVQVMGTLSNPKFAWAMLMTVQ
jgi:hypothetical protein